MQPALAELLRRRKDRSIAIILGVKERECDRHLPREAQLKLRKVILDQFNEFYDLLTDIANSLDDGDVVLNETYLAKIDGIHQAVVENGRSPKRLSEVP
jgi:hypothetical protein